MKKNISTLFFVPFLLFHFNLLSQNNSFPDIQLQTLEGESVSAAKILKPQKALLLVFFKSYEKKASENLFSLHDAYYENLSERDVKLIAICQDQSGTIAYIKPFIKGHALNIEVFIDSNGEFSKSMGVNNSAFTILFDQNLNEYCRYSGYCPGSDEIMCEKVLHCLENIK